MAFRYIPEIILVIAIIVFCLIFIYTGTSTTDSDFVGTDDLAAQKISESSGTTNGPVIPLIPQWIPPGPEIESTLFALQAAIGGVIVGGVFGYWQGQKKKG